MHNLGQAHTLKALSVFDDAFEHDNADGIKTFFHHSIRNISENYPNLDFNEISKFRAEYKQL